MPVADRTIFSFVVDVKYRFAFEGWHLARSLLKHCGGDPTAIHVQCTPELDEGRRDVFRELGCQIHELTRFGDGKHCNKLNQLDNLQSVDFDRVVLLDTDTVAIRDMRPFLRNDVILGKIVDAARPPREVLDEIAEAAGMKERPPITETDEGHVRETYVGNCNGGVYSIPKVYSARLSEEWKRWALWLLANNEVLIRAGLPQHVDQVSFWLAVQMAKLPYAIAPANINFFPYLGKKHCYHDESRGVALVHYHSALKEEGVLKMRWGRTPEEKDAVQRTNKHITSAVHKRLYWDFLYERFPGRATGPASHGDNLIAKRTLLRKQKVGAAESVLDVGCGDISVVKFLPIKRYVGIDISVVALGIAREARPEWEFQLAPAPDVSPAEMVLCLDVLTLQETEAAYLAMIDFLAEKTRGTLIVSGFAANSEDARSNWTMFFYEPLITSLQRTGRFKHIAKIGEIGSTAIYRCDV